MTATDWSEVVGLYDVQISATDTGRRAQPRGGCHAMRDGPAAGLRLIRCDSGARRLRGIASRTPAPSARRLGPCGRRACRLRASAGIDAAGPSGDFSNVIVSPRSQAAHRRLVPQEVRRL